MDKLTRLGIIEQDNMGNYILTKKVDPGILQAFVNVGKFSLPRLGFYAVFFTSVAAAYVIVDSGFLDLDALLRTVVEYAERGLFRWGDRRAGPRPPARRGGFVPSPVEQRPSGGFGAGEGRWTGSLRRGDDHERGRFDDHRVPGCARVMQSQHSVLGHAGRGTEPRGQLAPVRRWRRYHDHDCCGGNNNNDNLVERGHHFQPPAGSRGRERVQRWATTTAA
jgi:hypothetical protein